MEFRQITNRQGDKKERITEIIIRNTIRRMKNRTAHRLGWKAKWIKEGREEMIKSLCILFNRIKTNQIPVQW